MGSGGQWWSVGRGRVRGQALPSSVWPNNMNFSSNDKPPAGAKMPALRCMPLAAPTSTGAEGCLFCGLVLDIRGVGILGL